MKLSSSIDLFFVLFVVWIRNRFQFGISVSIGSFNLRKTPPANIGKFTVKIAFYEKWRLNIIRNEKKEVELYAPKKNNKLMNLYVDVATETIEIDFSATSSRETQLSVCYCA